MTKKNPPDTPRTRRLPEPPEQKPLALKAFYTLGDLEESTGLSKKRLKKLLAVFEVRVISEGRMFYVPLVELQRVPQIWDNILLAESIRQGM